MSRYLTSSIMGLGLFFFSQMSFAATELGECTESVGPLSFGGGAQTLNLTASNAGFLTNSLNTITGYSMVYCQLRISNGTATQKTSSYSSAGGNIDLNQRLTVGTRQYYKVVNTSDAFVNNYAYIYFQVQDTRSDIVGQRYNIGETAQFWSGVNGAGQSSTQGINVRDLTFYFVQAPTKQINITNLRIGTVSLSLVGPSATNPRQTITVSDRTHAYISATIRPPVNNTCIVGEYNVTMPNMNISSLSRPASESGRTNFSITVGCGSGLSLTNLNAMILDNNNATNQTHLLNNTGASPNVKVALYDTNNTPIVMGREFVFGRTSSATAPTATKNFYAKYYKSDAASTVPGPVRANATISVFYR